MTTSKKKTVSINAFDEKKIFDEKVSNYVINLEITIAPRAKVSPPLLI